MITLSAGLGGNQFLSEFSIFVKRGIQIWCIDYEEFLCSSDTDSLSLCSRSGSLEDTAQSPDSDRQHHRHHHHHHHHQRRHHDDDYSDTSAGGGDPHHSHHPHRQHHHDDSPTHVSPRGSKYPVRQGSIDI